jgi:hypothetical protein
LDCTKLLLGRWRNGIVDVIKLGDGKGKDYAEGQCVRRLQSMYAGMNEAEPGQGCSGSCGGRFAHEHGDAYQGEAMSAMGKWADNCEDGASAVAEDAIHQLDFEGGELGSVHGSTS